MKVRMKTQITGTRDGVRWPAPGGVVDLPSREAAKLVDAGFAEAVAEAPVERSERRPAAKRAEKRG